MRKNGTKYPAVDKLPAKAVSVSQYATANNISVAQVYVKYERYTTGYANGNKGSEPAYKIIQWQHMNWVVPTN